MRKKYRIRKESCYGSKPVFYAECSHLGIWWRSVWYDGIHFALPKQYETREEALDAIQRYKLGCVKEIEYV